MSNEFHIKLNPYKIKHLFRNIRKLNGGKNLLAKKLGITPATLDDYLKSGQDLLDKFDDKLQPIYELDIDAIDDEITAQKSDFIEGFLTQEGSNAISDKNRNAFEVYFIERKEQLKESYIYDFQKQIITNITWSENELENKKIILLMLFKLIYDRAQMSLDEELLYLKNRYAKSSSKHVAIVVKDLERRNKEDFGEKKELIDNTKALSFNQINNFTHYSIEYDKSKGLLKHNTAKMLPDNEEEIIDVEVE
jgi:hypothetical protein